MIIKRDPDIIKGYFEDYSGLLGGHADEVVFPENESDAQEILRDAAAKKTPVTISGGGTGVTGARVPFGGIVIATDCFNKIIDIDKKGLTARLGPAVRLSDLGIELSKIGLAYLPEPTEPNAFLGGTVSTNASGAKGFKYGPTRNYIKGLKIILSSGDILALKRGEHLVKKGKAYNLKSKNKEIKIQIPGYTMPGIKTAAGYYVKDNMDLLDIFIGHEGTLGFISEIEIALGVPPENIMSFFGFFSKEADALDFIKDAKKQNALSIEYMDSNSLSLLRTKYPNVPRDAACLVYFEQDFKKGAEDALVDQWTGLLEKYHAMMEKTLFADSDKEREKLTELRHALPEMVNEIVKRNRLPKVGTDIAVPDNNFNQMFDFYRESLISSKIDFVIFGHIGENHMHVNMLPKTEIEYKNSRQVYSDFVRKAVSLGGTVSAEHGIGKLKHSFLEIMYGKAGLEEMAALKKSLDPACILGVDNIFPKELLRIN